MWRGWVLFSPIDTPIRNPFESLERMKSLKSLKIRLIPVGIAIEMAFI